MSHPIPIVMSMIVVIKKFSKNAFTKIKMLMKKIEKRDRCLEM